MKKIKYGNLKETEIKEVSVLIEKLFKEFIDPDYGQVGKDTFLEYVSVGQIRERFQKENHIFLTAKDKDKIVGIIELRDFNHISLLFVDQVYHRQGIASMLLKKAVKLCLKVKPKLEEVEVNSSPYAEHIYEKLGFVKTEDKQEQDGIIYIPMQYKI
jgi:predicted GNAT family N-acyltransferase